jgi:hypothetical protein
MENSLEDILMTGVSVVFLIVSILVRKWYIWGDQSWKGRERGTKIN